MADVESVIDDLNQQIADEAEDIERWSQEESAEIYEGVATTSQMRAQVIREEMEAGN